LDGAVTVQPLFEGKQSLSLLRALGSQKQIIITAFLNKEIN
jgi:hypothetical protein